MSGKEVLPILEKHLEHNFVLSELRIEEVDLKPEECTLSALQRNSKLRSDPLMKCCLEGNLEQATNELQQGADPNKSIDSIVSVSFILEKWLQ